MYLISYDITSDKIRGKIAKKLQDYGKRVQYSVFECGIDRKRFRKLYAELTVLMDGVEEGSIRIYTLDKAAEEKVLMIGSSPVPDLEEQWNSIVIV